MGMLDSVGGFLGDAFSAYTSHREAEMQRDWSETEAARSREWQERMANSQYQRTVQDLNAAGLSPMLAYSKGASSLPSGATASSGAVGQGFKAGETESRYSQSALAREQLELAKSQKEVNVETARKVAKEAELASLRVLQEPARFYYEQAEAGSRINANSASTIKTDIDARNNLNLRTPSSDPYWYRDIKDGAKSIFEKFLEKTPKESFPWGLKGRR